MGSSGRSTADSNIASLPADRGFKAWTAPPDLAAGSTALPTAGLLMLRRIRRVPATSITNIVTYVAAGGTSLTSGQCFAALYTAAGALVGVTADQATAWAGVGVKTMALAGGPFTVTAGDHYVGVWFNGSAGPAFARNGTLNANLTNVGLSAPNFGAASADSGLTTTAPATFGVQTTVVYEWWFALS